MVPRRGRGNKGSRGNKGGRGSEGGKGGTGYTASVSNRIPILGVGIDPCTKSQVLERAHDWLADPHGRGRVIATVNAEFLVAASSDAVFRGQLAKADLAIADGVGVVWAAHFLARRIESPFARLKTRLQYLTSLARIFLAPRSITAPLPEKIPGSNLTLDLCRTASQAQAPVFLLGAGPGIADRAAKEITATIPSVKIVGTSSGSARPEEDSLERSKIQASGARLLLVAFGAKDQLAWLERNLPELPTVRVAMGVGGTFDFLAGARDPQHRFGLPASQPPAWMRSRGLDWFWRLLTQPYRWKRVLTAVSTFSRMVLAEKIAAVARAASMGA